jgi:hypothetical protein
MTALHVSHLPCIVGEVDCQQPDSDTRRAGHIQARSSVEVLQLYLPEPRHQVRQADAIQPPLGF